MLNSFDSSKEYPIFIKTIFSSMIAGSYRLLLMPIDNLKTILQVEGFFYILNKREKWNTNYEK
jgi:hypothetical protein